MRAGLPKWIVAAATIAVTGCGDGPPSALLVQEEDTWLTVPAFEIGGLHAGFQRIADVQLEGAGNVVYVVDPMESQVTAWRLDGSSPFSVGGLGQGPGEFRNGPDVLQVVPDGFRVRDRDRFVVFSRDGEYLRTALIPSSISHQGFRYRPLAPLPSGGFVAYPDIDWSYKSGWWGDDPVEELPIVRLVERNEHWVVDTLVVLDIKSEVLAVGGPNTAPRMLMRQPYANTDQAIYYAGSNSVIVVRSVGLEPGAVELTELSPKGDTTWFRRMRFTPIPLPATDADDIVSKLADGLVAFNSESSYSPGAVRKAVRDALHAPEYHPPVQDAVVLSNGELWMKTFEDAGVDTLTVWRAVRLGASASDSEDRRILLPTTFTPHDATDTHVWGVRLDAFDVRYAVGRRLLREADH